MLKIGIKFEEVVLIKFEDKTVRLVVEKRRGNFCALVINAPREIEITREKFINNENEVIDGE